MSIFLGALAFWVFVLAQAAAIIALRREEANRQPQAFDAALRDPRVRLIQHSAG